MLTALPELPATLTDLHIEKFISLVELPDLHHTRLTYLNCSDCPLLTWLPELPITLTLLHCATCRIAWLPELPATLTSLYCYDKYFIDKYDYDLLSYNIERFRNDPKTIERREINGMFNVVFK